MARGRGGSRNGTPGKTYENRTDLLTPKQPNVVAFKGQEWGEQSAQVARQQQAPSPTAPAPAQRPPAEAPIPRRAVSLDAPSERPWEPVTAGLDIGPGPGSEAIGGANELERLRPLLPVLELMASRPDASTDARNFVRRLRGALGGMSL